MANILVVEDDKAINTLIRRSLELVNHTCMAAYDGVSAEEMLEKHDFDLILLDVMMPHKDGFQVLRNLSNQIPAIFLTARDTKCDKIHGLNLGADDYMVKPFDIEELQARVEAVLRRTKKEVQQFHLGDVEVDMVGRLVWMRGKVVDFTPQEFNLIEILLKNKNIALSRERLLEAAWGFDYMGETRTVDTHIYTIRKKLGWENVIKTVFKIGYRLEVPR